MAHKALHRLEQKHRSEAILVHAAKRLVAYVLDSLIMQAKNKNRHISFADADEYVYISPHAYIIPKPAACPRKSKKLTTKLTSNVNVGHDRGRGRKKARARHDRTNLNTNMHQGERHLVSCRNRNTSHLESIYYDASSPDTSSEIIEAASTLSKWAIETSQKELRSILKNQLQEISRGTKRRLEQEVVNNQNRARMKKRDMDIDTDGCVKRHEDLDTYGIESKRLVQLVINTVLSDMETEFKDKELDEIERRVNGYESVVRAEALWLTEEVMEKAVSEIQKELAFLENKISRRQQKCPVDEALLSREIGDIVNRSISNAIQDRESKRVNLVFTDVEERDSGTTPTYFAVDKSASCLAKQAICESIGGITEAVRKSSAQEVCAECRNCNYSPETDNDGGETFGLKLDFRPDSNVNNDDTVPGDATNQTELDYGGIRPMYTSTKYISLGNPDGNGSEATVSGSDGGILRQHSTQSGNHRNVFTKEYPPVIRPLERLETIASVDESQENITSSPTRDLNLIARKNSVSQNTSYKMANEYGQINRSVEEIIDTTTNFIGENVSPPSPRRNSGVMPRKDSRSTDFSNGMENEFQVTNMPIENSYTVETEENMPPHPHRNIFTNQSTLVDSSNRVVHEYEQTERLSGNTGPTNYAMESEEHFPPPPPPISEARVKSRSHSIGSSNRMLDEDEQMEMLAESTNTTNYAVESYRNLPPPPPREDSTFRDSRMIDEYPQAERADLPTYNWESGEDVAPATTRDSIVSEKQNTYFRNRYVNEYGQIESPAEDPDTTGYAGDTEGSIVHDGELHNFRHSEASGGEVGHSRGLRGHFNETGDWEENVPQYLDPACQMGSRKHVTMKRNHRRVITEYRIPSDDDTSQNEDDIGQCVAHGKHDISLTNYGRTANVPVWGHEENIRTKSCLGDRVYDFEDTQETGFTTFSPGIKSMGSSQNISFAKRRECILRHYKPPSTPVGNRYVDDGYEAEPSACSPRIKNGILLNEDMIETEYEPQYNCTKQYTEEWQKSNNRYSGGRMCNFEESQTPKYIPESNCDFEGLHRSSWLGTRDRNATCINDAHSPVGEDSSVETNIRFSSNRDTCETPRRKQYPRNTEECTETDFFPVEENIKHFEEYHKPRGRYVDEGIKTFERPQTLQISPESNCHFGGVQKARDSAVRDESAIFRDQTSVAEPSCSLDESIHYFEDLQRQSLNCPPQSIAPRSTETEPKCFFPNRDTCVASQRKQHYQRKTEGCTNDLQHQAVECPSPGINPRSVETGSRCPSPSRNTEECVETDYVGENIRHFEDLPREAPRCPSSRIKPRSTVSTSQCYSPYRNTCIASREPEECSETDFRVHNNIRHFEEYQIPQTRLVCEGIHNFENMQMTKTSPCSNSHVEGFQNSRRLTAKDNCVEENIHNFEDLQRQALGYPSPCIKPKSMSRQPMECTETRSPVRENIQCFEESQIPEQKYVHEGIRDFELRQTSKFNPGSISHYEGFQKSSRLTARDRCIDENVQRQPLGCPRSVETRPRCPSPTRSTCMASRDPVFRDREDNLRQDLRCPSPCMKRRSIETRSGYSCPGINTCMTSRLPEECTETGSLVSENIRQFEECPRPKPNLVGEGIRDFEYMQRSKVNPGSISHYEGFQKSSRLTAEDKCVDENIHHFEDLQRQALGCPSPGIKPRSIVTRSRCSSPVRNTCMPPRDAVSRYTEDSSRQALRCPSAGMKSRLPEPRSGYSSPGRNTCMTQKQPEECIESDSRVSENIRHFEESPRPNANLVGEGIRDFEYMQRTKISPGSIGHFEGFQNTNTLPARGRCVDENIHQFEDVQRQALETRSRYVSPSRNTCMISRDPDSFQQEDLRCSSPYMKSRSLETRSGFSSPGRNTCMTSRQPEECRETESPIGENIRHFENVQRQALKCPSYIKPKSTETKSRNICVTSKEPEEYIETDFPVSENIRHFEESPRPKNKCVGEGIQNFEYIERTQISPGSVGHCEGFQRSNRLPTIDNCVDENIHHFEDLQRYHVPCIKGKPIETRSRYSSPRRDTCLTSREPEADYVDKAIQHFEEYQSPQTNYVREGIQDFENLQRKRLSPESDIHFDRCRDDAVLTVPSNRRDENIHYFQDCVKPKSTETRSRCSSFEGVASRRNEQSTMGYRDCVETGFSSGNNVHHFEESQRSNCTPDWEGIQNRETSQRRQVRPAACAIYKDNATVNAPSCSFDENIALRSVVSGTKASTQASESRCSFLRRDTSIIPKGHDTCIDRTFSVGENVHNFEDCQSPKNYYENFQRQKCIPISVYNTEGSQRSYKSSAGEIDYTDSREAPRACSPRIRNKSNEMESRCSHSSSYMNTTSRRQRETEECSTEYQTPKSQIVGPGMRDFEDFQRPKFNPESFYQSEGSQRSNISCTRDRSTMSRLESTIGPPSSGFDDRVNQFEVPQRSGQSYENNGSIISVENTSMRTPSSRDEEWIQDGRYVGSADGYANKSHSTIFDYEKNYPSDDMRSFVYPIFEENIYPFKNDQWKGGYQKSKTIDDERERVSHIYDVSGSDRKTMKGRFVTDSEYCRIKCNHAINELLLMQKLLAGSKTGISETERILQKLLDNAFCHRFSTVAKKAMVATVLDTNLEERVKCGLLMLNVTYALHLNISDYSLTSEAITNDTKRFVKEILNGIVSREPRDILQMKGDILNGFKIQLNLEEMQINGQECSLYED